MTKDELQAIRERSASDSAEEDGYGWPNPARCEPERMAKAIEDRVALLAYIDGLATEPERTWTKTVTITLTIEQHRKLLNELENVCDEGPRGEGWTSPELDGLIVAIRGAAEPGRT